MTLEQLHKAIRTGRYYDDQNIWYELGDYYVTKEALLEIPERVWVDTVRGYRQRHGLGGDSMESGT